MKTSKKRYIPPQQTLVLPTDYADTLIARIEASQEVGQYDDVKDCATLYYAQESKQYTLELCTKALDQIALFDSEIGRLRGKLALVFGYRDVDGMFHPFAYGMPSRSLLFVEMAHHSQIMMSLIDGHRIRQGPYASVEAPANRGAAGNAVHGSNPSQEDKEDSTDLTAEDLARLRGDAPIHASHTTRRKDVQNRKLNRRRSTS